MTSFNEEENAIDPQLTRRGLFATSAAAAATLGAGQAAGQTEGEEPVETPGPAANVDEAGTIEEGQLNQQFPSTLPIAYLNTLFIEWNTPEHPIIGKQMTDREGIVINRVSSQSELDELSGGIDWGRYTPDGDDYVGPLMGPFEWVLTDSATLSDDAWAQFDLVRIVGTAQPDQRFYDKYAFVPYLWAVVPTNQAPAIGDEIRFSGTVEYAGQSEGTPSSGTTTRTTQSAPVEFENGEGPYMYLSQAAVLQAHSTLGSISTPSWRSTAEGSNQDAFTGLQVHGETDLSTETSDVDYDFSVDFPQPTGASLVTHRGTATDVSFGPNADNTATLTTQRQRIHIGSTRPTSFDDEGGESGSDDEESQFTNTVAVIDESGSMGSSDTRSGDSKMTIAKESAKTLVRFLEDGAKLGVASFSSGANELYPVETIDSPTRTDMQSAIDTLNSGGGTDIYEGLRQGMQMLEGTTGPKSIIFLSDGRDSYDETILDELRSKGITVYVIGMGSDVEKEQLRNIAQSTGGAARLRPQPDDIRSIFQEFAVTVQNWAPLSSDRFNITQGETKTGTAVVDSSCESAQFTNSHEGGAISMTVYDPNGDAISESDSNVTYRSGATSESWTIEDPESGKWEWEITKSTSQNSVGAAAGDAAAEDWDDVVGQTSGSNTEVVSVNVSADSEVNAELEVEDFHHEQTGMTRAELIAREGDERYTGAKAKLLVETEVDTTQVDLATETNISREDLDDDGVYREEVELRDDRGGPDPVANDGIYTGYFHPKVPGDLQLTAQISGGDVDDLERDVTRQLSIDSVVSNPIRPYENRDPIQPDTESLLDTALQYAPFAAALVALVGAGAYYKFYYQGGGGQGGAGGGGGQPPAGQQGQPAQPPAGGQQGQPAQQPGQPGQGGQHGGGQGGQPGQPGQPGGGQGGQPGQGGHQGGQGNQRGGQGPGGD